MFTKLEGNQAFWPDDTTTTDDAVILATGYTPNLNYLTELEALTDTGHPRHKKGLSTTHPGLGYVGLEWQRSLSSASLRGVGRDAHYVVRRLTPAGVALCPGTTERNAALSGHLPRGARRAPPL